jgi:hypothetical protein
MGYGTTHPESGSLILSYAGVLLRKGFSATMVHRLMQFVSGGQMAVNVKGEIWPFFRNARGVRQGDPLSPILFDFMVDWATVCKPKEFGGLGILNTRHMNIAMMLKWIWKLYQNAKGTMGGPDQGKILE